MMPATLSVFDAEVSGLYKPKYNWGYRQRYPEGPVFTFCDLWPSTRMCSGDPTAPLAIFGLDSQQAGEWEPEDGGLGGNTRPYFINGQVFDNGANPLGGAVVDGFLTADNSFVGSTATNSLGYYSLPTLFTAVAHYLVAYYPGSPNLAGTTVNTLIPTSTPA